MENKFSALKKYIQTFWGKKYEEEEEKVKTVAHFLLACLSVCIFPWVSTYGIYVQGIPYNFNRDLGTRIWHMFLIDYSSFNIIVCLNDYKT